MQYQKYKTMQFCIQLYIDICKIISYLQANPHPLKTENINSLIFTSTIIKQVVLIFFVNDFFFFQFYTLHEKCLEFLEFFLSIFSNIWTEYRGILPISPDSVCMQENIDQKNLTFRHFLRSDSLDLFKKEKGFLYTGALLHRLIV